jgi:DedD protein
MFKQKRDPAPDKPRLEPADAVQQARTRARQRLIGAIVLLAIGIIGFPLVFETQPRPIPVDVPIEIPRRDSLPPLAVPPARSPSTRPAQAGSDGVAATSPVPASVPTAPSAAATTARASAPPARGATAVINESSADAGREVAAPARVAPAERAASRAIAQAASAADPARRAASNAVAAASTAARSSADGERARALLENRSVASTDEQRFVVQVGAFADAEAARETRKNVEKLGLKTYTQVAQTSAGNRIRVRVGPFASRGEAEAALAKAKAAGLSAVLLTL